MNKHVSMSLTAPADPPMSIFCKLVAFRSTPEIILREGSYTRDMRTSPFESDYDKEVITSCISTFSRLFHIHLIYQSLLIVWHLF